MPRASEIRTNFTAGELSTLINARTQFQRYFDGSEILQNWVVLTQGPIFRRKGFKFIGEVKDSTKSTRIIPFEFSTVQTYAIELGAGYLRFFSQQGRVLDNATTITGATNANPIVITDTAHPYSNGDEIIIQGVAGMTELNGKKYTIANSATNTYELQGIDGTGFGTYTSGGTSAKIHEITNPYAESELFDIKFVQDSDVLYMVHPNHPIQKLIRVSANTFTLNDVQLVKGPYIDENIISTDLVTITGGAPWTEGSTLTLTASGGHTPFTANHVGGLWQVKSGTDIAYLKITGFTSSTIVTVEALNDVPASLQGVAKFTWSEGEFSDARSYAGAVTFHEQRMVLAGSINSPQRVWFSNSNADYENFEAGTEADNSFIITIASQRGDPIRWLFSDQVLFVGTSGSIFRITSSRNSSAIAPNDIDVKRQIAYGCSNIQPELIGEVPIYMQKNNKTVRAISFSINSDKYKAADFTVDSDHITNGGIVSLEYQQIPLSSLWAVRSDGEIAKLTLETDQEVQAWSRYVTQGNFESVAVVSDAQDNDEIYTIVKRTIDGVDKRYVEVQEPNYNVDNLNSFYVDSGLTYNGTQSTATLTLTNLISSLGLITEDGFNTLITEDETSVLVTEDVDITFTSDVNIFSSDDVGKEIHELRSYGTGRAVIKTFVDAKNVTVRILEIFSSATLLPNQWAVAIKTVTGLEHLEGETVVINSDGATMPSKIVENGAIAIDFAGSIIHVGLAYTSKQKNMPIEATVLSKIMGTSQHKDKRINALVIRFADTLGGKIINSDTGIETPLPARSLNNNMNEAPPLFNGDLEITVGTGWDKKGQIEILQEDPQPMTIKSITYRVTVNDK